MDMKKIVLSHYKNATDDFLISYIDQPTEALSPHSHDYFQLYYILRGSINHHIDENSALLCYGDVFIIPPNVNHYISWEEKDTAFYSLSFTPRFLDNIGRQNSFVTDFLELLVATPLEELHPKLSLQVNDSLFIVALLNRIMKEFAEKNTGSEDIIKECTVLLITLFSRNYFNEKPDIIPMQFKTTRQSVLYCINYISEHCTEDITLDEISRNATLSKACFCKMFSSLTGMSFKKFLNAKRIEKAVEYIMTDEYKITTISELCGYSDFSTFYRNFKKITGVSPLNYKRSEYAIEE